MKPIKFFLTLSMMGLIAASSSSAQTFKSNVSKKGTTAAPFLSIGQGSRGLSMGSAFVAVVDDPSSMYWNPAGLSDVYGGAAIVDHTRWFAGIQYNYVAGALRIGDMGVLGMSFTSSSIDEMKVTTIEEPDGTGETFGIADIAFSVAFAMKLTDKFSIGFNPKIVYQKIWKTSATGMAIDVGVKYETPFEGIVLGMAITNFGSKMKLDGNSLLVLYDPDQTTAGNNGRIPASLETEEWALPLNFKFGIAYKAFADESNKLTFAVDASHPSDNYESIDLGGEYVFNDFLALRGGYKSMLLVDSEEGMTFGIGVKQSVVGAMQFSFDYAYQDFGRLKDAQKFTVGILF
ncbi:MAG: PorV/PorQ family protein [Ignavibacteriales bacterium]|nr:PorV/PorQ family protein [Ignavibacteriales bacterium]